jgi:hypothetical protein
VASFDRPAALLCASSLTIDRFQVTNLSFALLHVPEALLFAALIEPNTSSDRRAALSLSTPNTR